MTEPEKRPAEPLTPHPPLTGLIPLDELERRDLDPVPAPYVPEPLFNKKLMLMWALGAAAIWFAVKFITPIAIESAKTAVVESVKAANEQHPGTTVKIERNGNVISITRVPAPPPATAAPAPPGSATQPAPAPKAADAAKTADAARK